MASFLPSFLPPPPREGEGEAKVLREREPCASCTLNSTLHGVSNLREDANIYTRGVLRAREHRRAIYIRASSRTCKRETATHQDIHVHACICARGLFARLRLRIYSGIRCFQGAFNCDENALSLCILFPPDFRARKYL